MSNVSNAVRLSALCLCSAVVMGSFAPAAAASSTAENIQTYAAPQLLPDSSTLLEGYLRSNMGLEVSSAKKLPNASGRVALNELDQAIYDILYEDICDVLGCWDTSTHFVISRSDLRSQLSPGTVINDFSLKNIINALLLDHPYELFWYDKTSGVSVMTNFKNLEFDFPVSADYSEGGKIGSTTVDTNKIRSVNTAVKTASEIVYSVDTKWSDYRVMNYFKDKICEMVSYNNAAASNSSTIPYGDPWQLVYVFDGDDSTTVVCEGYSKAFKYLCDMYRENFNSNVQCDLMAGLMTTQTRTGTASGGHMWNKVSINGTSYLVDVTNSDKGSIGEKGELFFNGADGDFRYTDEDGNLIGYTIAVGTSSYVTYQYDNETLESFSSDELNIARSAPMLHTVVWNNEDGTALETDEMTAEGETPSYDGEEPETENKTFKGWSPDVNKDSVVSGSEEIVTYTAVYDNVPPKKKYTVEFVAPQLFPNEIIVVNEGECAAAPDGLADYTDLYGISLGEPDGWYTDKDFTETFDLATPITENITLYAGYIVISSWYDDDGKNLYNARHWFGKHVDYPYGDPVKPSDDYYDYEFLCWAVDGEGAFGGSCDYRAVYDRIERKYRVTWIADGEILETADYPYNEQIEYHGKEPEKEGYIFAGWNPEPIYVTGNMTFEAIFAKTDVVTWHDYDGTVLATTDLPLPGETPVIDLTPTRPSDETYDYKFVGWQYESEISYRAIYEAVPRESELVSWTWYDYDDTIIATADVPYNETPDYIGEAPADYSYGYYYYRFIGFKQISGTEFVAEYEKTPIKYRFIWYDREGAVLYEAEGYIDDMPDYPYDSPADYIDKDGKKYCFSRWESELDNEARVMRYIPVYGEQDTVFVSAEWRNWDGTVLCSKSFAEGETPEYDLELPVRPSDDEYEYVFREWSREETEDKVIYTAQYEAKKIEKPDPHDDPTDNPDAVTRLLGDVNKDGAVDSNDALTMLRYSIGVVELNDEDLFFGDVDENTVVDSADAVVTLRFSVGITDFEKIGTEVTYKKA